MQQQLAHHSQTVLRMMSTFASDNLTHSWSTSSSHFFFCLLFTWWYLQKNVDDQKAQTTKTVNSKTSTQISNTAKAAPATEITTQNQEEKTPTHSLTHSLIHEAQNSLKTEACYMWVMGGGGGGGGGWSIWKWERRGSWSGSHKVLSKFCGRVMVVVWFAACVTSEANAIDDHVNFNQQYI